MDKKKQGCRGQNKTLTKLALTPLNTSRKDKEEERRTGPRNIMKGTTPSRVLQSTKRSSEKMIRQVSRKKKPELAEKEKASISGEHNANGQRNFSKDTGITRGNKRESKKVIITTRHLTATKP